MDALTQQLMQQLAGAGLAKIGQQIGSDPQTTNSALSVALPLLVSALAKNASQPEGAQALHQALTKDHTGTILNDWTIAPNCRAAGNGNARKTAAAKWFDPQQIVSFSRQTTTNGAAIQSRYDGLGEQPVGFESGWFVNRRYPRSSGQTAWWEVILLFDQSQQDKAA
jgi:hypothetical protein